MTRTLRSYPLPVLALAIIAACAKHDGQSSGLRALTTPRFETRIEISTGTNTHSDYAVADLDADGRLDMAVAGLSGELQVMLGTGSGFSPGQVLSIGGGPVWLTSGDLDGDGDRDLVIVRTDTDDAQVLINNGHATFEPGQILPVGSSALAVVIGDANDDGFLDVIVSRLQAPEIVVHNGDGSGAFAPGAAFVMPGGGRPVGIHTGDVTRDLHPDLIVCDAGNERVLVYPGLSGTDFAPTPIELPVPGRPGAASVGDLNGDGWNDICVSAFERGVFVVITGFTTGPGYTSLEVPVPGAPSISTIGDVTGDGLADLVGCVLGRAAMVVYPQVAGGFGEPTQLESTGLPLRPVIADIDRNGRNDLLVLSGLGDKINLWFATGDGRLTGSRSYETGLPVSPWIAAGDFDRDGHADCAVAGNHSSRIVFMSGHADGSMTVAQNVDVGRNVFNVEASDLDGDGRMDLVVPVAGGVKILRNRGDVGAFDFEVLPGAGSVMFGAGSGLFGVAVADLNRDGHRDLAVVDYQAGTLQILRGTSTPFEFEIGQLLPAVGGPVDVAIGDFTADGIPDVAVSRSGRADIAVFRNTSNGELEPYLTVPVGSAPSYLVTGDFNRDRHADLVVSNAIDGSVTVLLAQQNGFTSTDIPVGRGLTALLARDLTNDGIGDLLVVSLRGDDFHVLVGDGRGNFPTKYSFPGTYGASGAALQDVDGDQRPELMITSLLTSRVAVVKNISQ